MHDVTLEDDDGGGGGGRSVPGGSSYGGHESAVLRHGSAVLFLSAASARCLLYCPTNCLHDGLPT